ncbi:MAG: ATP-dependent zinc metalloprotease FtsH [Spirochaetia bacterium]
MNDKNRKNWLQQDDQNGKKPGRDPWRYVIFFLILLFLIPLINSLFSTGDRGSITYSEFRNYLEQGRIDEVTVTGEKIEGVIQDQSGAAEGRRQFVTYIPSFGDDKLMPLLEEEGVRVRARPEQNVTFFSVLIGLLPYVILIWIGYSLYRSMRSQGRGIFSVGQNKAKLYEEKREKTTFADVAGLKGEKDEVMEIVDYLKHPDRYRNVGAETPRGVLLVGPPGTGKTLIARAIAGEAGVPFYSISGSDFMEMFVGVGASRVRNLFEAAKKNAPSIIFIDELDSIGRHRGAGVGGGHDEREQTLNQMLSELDGFEPNTSTIVIAATNRPDILDPALLRPGRFDRRITIGLPSAKDREEILKVHARNKPLADTVDLAKAARNIPGFSGADIRNLLNEAAILTARKQKKSIEQGEIDDARDKVLMGLERRNLMITEDEKKIVAYHEAGHALIAAALPNTDPIHKVSIIPREHAMGVTQQLPEEEKYIFSKEYLNDRITVMLGGRASEEIMFDSITSGAENDLKQATRMVRKMVTEWGMGTKLGLLSVGDRQDVFLGEDLTRRRDYSDSTAREVDDEIKSVLNGLYINAKELLKKKKEALVKLADLLLEKEEASGEDIKQILAGAAG